MAKIDILVSHYNEPAEMVGSFLDRLDEQDADGFGVIIGNDGHDVPITPEVIGSRPYDVKYVETYHGGVSHIRNVLLHESDAEYVAFCDCDDHYLEGGLKRLIELCDGCDVVSSRFVSVRGDGSTYVYSVMTKLFHGKAFRREYVIENARFDEDFIISRDPHFVNQAIVGAKSIVRCEEPFYVWDYRADSVFRGTENFYVATLWYMIESYGRLTEMYEDDAFLCGVFACRLVHMAYVWMHFEIWKSPDWFSRAFSIRCLSWWLKRYYARYLAIPEGGRKYRYGIVCDEFDTDIPFGGIDDWVHEVMREGESWPRCLSSATE